ncbi:MAG TPA: hypothetical protein VLC09_00070, partial [Polyangiaceae bacterium]|nr:hypothetical protein [Polyangiaceae bacterium]
MASLPTPVPPSGALSVVVTARGEDSFEVTFEGPLRLGWIARLVGALSRRHISIVRVVAERSTLGQWRAQLELRGQAGTPDVRTLDWEALCDEVPSSPNDASAPRLSTFRLERGEGDRLELVVTAPDEVG